jgi:hypothetical protein
MRLHSNLWKANLSDINDSKRPLLETVLSGHIFDKKDSLFVLLRF